MTEASIASEERRMLVSTTTSAVYPRAIGRQVRVVEGLRLPQVWERGAGGEEDDMSRLDDCTRLRKALVVLQLCRHYWPHPCHPR